MSVLNVYLILSEDIFLHKIYLRVLNRSRIFCLFQMMQQLLLTVVDATTTASVFAHRQTLAGGQRQDRMHALKNDGER